MTARGEDMSRLVLSLDGGGIRGAATTQFLTHVEAALMRAHGKTLRDCVDFYAGTSTGSIIALALATTDLSIAEINDIYSYERAKDIFNENRGFLEIDGINAPKYEGAGKTKALKDNFGDAKLGDVGDDKHVLAVSYGVERRKPEVLKSTNPAHCALASWQVANASSAAPTYFPTEPLSMAGEGGDFWLIDGGVTANNPTMCAIAESIKAWPQMAIQDLRVLSVGTGYRTRRIDGDASTEWGALQWFTKGHILDVLTDERVVAYQAKTIIADGNYIRVNADMRKQAGLPNPPKDAMDDISRENITRLKAMGDFWFEQYGEAAVALLLDTYEGPSLDRIDADTGLPR